MTALSAYIQSMATGRNVLIALALLVLWLGLFNLVLTPLYQSVSAGFVPFDLQFPLTREMIVIQMGAMSEGSRGAYINFALADTFFPVIGAAFVILFWAWLIEKSGSATLNDAFRRGWWIWALFPLVCDLAENAMFLAIMNVAPEPMPEMIDNVVEVHRGKMVFLTITQLLTGVLVMATVVMWARRPKAIKDAAKT